jgi:hypothetical protein
MTHLLLAAGLAVSVGFVVPPGAAADQSGTVYLATVPAVRGVTFRIGGVTATTRADGTTSVAVGSLNGIAKRVVLSGSSAGAARVKMTRVTPGSHVPHESHLRVGLDVSSSVRLSLVAGSTAVNPATVQRIRLHSTLGQTVDLDVRRTSTVTLAARSTSLIHGKLIARPVLWGISQVDVGSSGALSASTPPFDPFGHPTWALRLNASRGTVVIRTVPSTPDVAFQLEGAVLVTGRDGTITAPVGDVNNLRDKLRLGTRTAGDVEVSSLRVSSERSKIKHQRRLVAALDVRRPVRVHFVDLQGRAVATSLVSGLRLSVGSALVTMLGAELDTPVPFLVTTTSRVNGGWEARPAAYVLHSVRIHGSEAVFDGRQRFVPGRSGVWTVRLAVFRMTVSVHDAFFGNQIESRALVTRPDGVDYAITLSSGRPAVVPAMVRGLYGLSIDSAVVAGHTKILVSRDDRVDLRVVTLLDAVVMVTVGLLLLIATVMCGRTLARRRVPAKKGAP